VTVLYWLGQTDNPRTLPPGGLPGAGPARALALPYGLTAIVATLPQGLYSLDAVNEKMRDMDWVSMAALGHEQLLESVMRSSRALLPMKLLTLFSGDDRLIKDLAKQRRMLARAATHVAGCEEYGLRLFALEGGPEPASAARPSSRPRRTGPTVHVVSSLAPALRPRHWSARYRGPARGRSENPFRS
jgi:hypothetical protein